MTSGIDVAPAGDPADGASVDRAALCSQADGHDVVGELDPGGETEKADVVVIFVVNTGGVVLGVNDDLRDVQGHLVGVAVLLALTAQDDGIAIHVGANRKKNNKNDKKCCHHNSWSSRIDVHQVLMNNRGRTCFL